jgi:hypothetical protein
MAGGPVYSGPDYAREGAFGRVGDVMGEAEALRGPGAAAARPSPGLGPVSRPTVVRTGFAPGRLPPMPASPSYPPAQSQVPVGPAPIGDRPHPATAPGEPFARTVARPGYQVPRTGFGLPSLRRNVCPHFYMTGVRGSVPIQAAHLLKALVRQEQTVSRCQLRGGVHMEQGYVYDVCLGSRFNQCVFYEDDLGS